MTDGGAAFQPGRGNRRSGRGALTSGTRCSATATARCSWIPRWRVTCGQPRSPPARSAGSPAACSTGGCWPTTRASTWSIDGFLEAGPGENPGDRISREGRDVVHAVRRGPGAAARRRRPGCTRPHSRWAGGGRWRLRASSARETSRRSASLSGPAAPACSYSAKASTGAPPTWDRTGGSPTRPGHSSRSRGPPPRRRSCRRGSLAWCLAPCLNQTRTLTRTHGDFQPDPEPAAATAPGTSLAPRRPSLTPAPRPTAPRVISPVPVPSQEWGVKPSYPSYVGAKMPTDVKIVVGALVVTAIVAATIIGILASNVIVAVIVAVVGLLGIGGFLWMSRL